MRWLLKLKKPDENLERWREILETVPERVHEENGSYYLRFPELEHEEEPRDAYDHATAYLDELNRALNFIGKDSDQLEASGFYRVEEDGAKRAYVFLEPARPRTRAYPVLSESGRRDKRVQKRQRFVELAMNDEKVSAVLELKDLDLTTLNMYNILEGIVRYDLGGGSWKDGFSKVKELEFPFSKNEMSALKRSLQLRKTAGTGARHYFLPSDPPKRELSLHQMRQMIQELTRNWLDYKKSNFNQTE